MEVSEFWRDWAAELNFKPEKLVFDEKETNGDALLTASDPRMQSVPKDTDPKMLGNSADGALCRVYKRQLALLKKLLSIKK